MRRSVLSQIWRSGPFLYPDKSPRSPEALIITDFAGQPAEGHFRGRRPRFGYHSDNELAADLSFYFFGSIETREAFLKLCFYQSRDLVVSRWWAVEAVALALLERKRLTEAEVIAAIRERSDAMMRKPASKGSNEG